MRGLRGGARGKNGTGRADFFFLATKRCATEISREEDRLVQPAGQLMTLLLKCSLYPYVYAFAATIASLGAVGQTLDISLVASCRHDMAAG